MATLSIADVARDLPDLLHTLERSRIVSVEGVSGVGKTQLLRNLSLHLERAGERPVWVTAKSVTLPNEVALLAATHLLVTEWQRVPDAVLQRVKVAASTGVVVVATHSLHQKNPFLAVPPAVIEPDQLAPLGSRVTVFTVRLRSRRELMRMACAFGPSRQLSRADAISLVGHAWGRPGWLKLLRDAATDDPLFVGSLDSGEYSHPTAHPALLNVPGMDACAELTGHECAVALAISQLDTQPIPSLVSLFDAESITSLVTTGVLIADPVHSDNWGVPSIFAPMLSTRVSEPEIQSVGYDTTVQLLTQSQLGLPLSARAEAFCEWYLMRSSAAPAGAHAALSPIQQSFLEQQFSSSIVFGAGETAKHILLQLGTEAPSVCALQRARLVALLQGAPAGLQSLFIEGFPQQNCSLPSADPAVRTGLLGLRALLASETGQPFKLSAESPLEASLWQHTLSILEAWNTPDHEPLPHPQVLTEAPTENHPIVHLLARLLTELENRLSGVSDDPLFSLQFSADLTHEIGAYIERTQLPRQLDDLFLTAIIGNEILQVIAPKWPDNRASVSNLTLLLAGGKQHQRWASHLTQAKQHLMCGAIDLFFSEFTNFRAQVPRFLPLRLQHIIANIAGYETREPHSAFAPGFVSVLQYFSGNFDAFIQKKPPLPGSSRRAQLGLVIPSGWWPSGDSGAQPPSSSLSPTPYALMAAHLHAHHSHNPNALQKIARELLIHSFWGPALHALQEARRIYQSRRASGGSASITQQLEEFEIAFQARTPWYVNYLGSQQQQQTTPLTPREQEIAVCVSEGLSNPQIAEQLHCSVRTVESHIANARAKLGVPSRKALGLKFSVGPVKS